MLSPTKDQLDKDGANVLKQELTKENMQFKIKTNLTDIPGVKIGTKSQE